MSHDPAEFQLASETLAAPENGQPGSLRAGDLFGSSSEIIKIKNGPYEDANKVLDKLKSLGWSCDVLRTDELHSHGLASSDFRHTYIWTVLCVKPNSD